MVFWNPEVRVGEAAAFQLSVMAPSNVDMSYLPISSLTIQFTEDFSPLTVRHVVTDSVAEMLIRRVDLGHVSAFGENREDVQADLRWKPGSKIVFSGTMASDASMTMNVCQPPFLQAISDHAVIKVSKVVLRLEEHLWSVEIPFDSFTSREGSIPVARWLCSVDPVQYFPITREVYSSAM